MRYRRIIEPGATYFFTLVVHERRRLFASSENVGLWHAAIAKVQLSRPFTVDAEVMLPDHIHVIWTLPDCDGDFATRIRLAKTFFSRSLGNSDTPVVNGSRQRKGERGVWQRRYWEHLISD